MHGGGDVQLAVIAGSANPQIAYLILLAGPGTGLEMMTPVGRQMPTPNFFSEGGYSRNPVVRDKTAAELLAALESRMEVHLKKPGSIEFAQIFDEVARR